MLRMLLSWLMASLMLIPLASAEEDASLRMLSLNVGKADCHLLACGESLYMVDTGTVESWGTISAALRQMNVTHLDGVIITHTDGDHAGGAWALAQSGVQVDAWYASAFYTGVKEKKHPAVLAAELCGKDVIWLRSGDAIPLDGGSLTVLGPLQPDDIKENNNSVVLLAQSPDGSILLAGDMEFPEEDDLMAAGLVPPCTVLKVGNHGEDDATTNEFAAAVRPQLAVVSTNSREEHDTPARRVVTLLTGVGADVLVTQNAPLGILVTLHDGTAQAEMLPVGQYPPFNAMITITGKDPKDDSITLHNGGEDADLSGWFIRSERGGETFVFPEGTVLEAGESITVTGENGSGGDLRWPEKKVWHKSKDDRALLFDAYGRQIDERD